MGKGQKLYYDIYIKKKKKKSIFFNFSSQLTNLNKNDFFEFLYHYLNDNRLLSDLKNDIDFNSINFFKEFFLENSQLLAKREENFFYVKDNNLLNNEELFYFIKEDKFDCSFLGKFIINNLDDKLSVMIRKDFDLLKKINNKNSLKVELLKIYSGKNFESSPFLKDRLEEIVIQLHNYKYGKDNNFYKESLDKESLDSWYIAFYNNLDKILDSYLSNFDNNYFADFAINVVNPANNEFKKIFFSLISNKSLIDANSKLFNDFSNYLADLIKLGNYTTTEMENNYSTQFYFNTDIQFIDSSIFKDKKIMTTLIKKYPALVFLVNCNIDENEIINALNKIDKNAIKNTLDYVMETGDYSRIQNSNILSNKYILKWLIEIDGNYFQITNSDLAKDEELYKLALQNGLKLNPNITNSLIYKNKSINSEFYEKYSSKIDIINQLEAKIGLGCLLYIKNDRLLDKDVIDIFGIDNISSLIKYGEVPNRIPDFNELIDRFSLNNFINLYKLVYNKQTAKNFNSNNKIDIVSFINYCNILTKYKNIFLSINNLTEFFNNNIIPMSKIFCGEDVNVNSKEDIENYTRNLIYHINSDLNRKYINGEYLDLDISIKHHVEKLLSLKDTDSNFWLEKYSFNLISFMDLLEGNKDSFTLIAEKLKEKDKSEKMISLANKLSKILHLCAISKYGSGYEMHNFIKLLYNQEGQNIISDLIFIIHNFDYLAKQLYAYEFSTVVTNIDNIKTVDTISGVKVHELQGEEFFLPVHTDDFGSSKNKGIKSEKEIGKNYLCWTLTSSIHPGFARGKGITFIYGNVCNDTLLLGGPYDLYSSGANNNDPLINADIEDRLLPSEYFSKFTLQRFNELVSRRNTRPTAILVENRDEISKEILSEAQRLKIPIVSSNIKLYEKKHLEKILKTIDDLKNNITAKNVEELLYLSTTYFVGYDRRNLIQSMQDNYTTDEKYNFEKKYGFTLGSIPSLRYGTEEYNFLDLQKIVDNILSNFENKEKFDKEDYKIMKLFEKFINLTIAKSKEEKKQWAESSIISIANHIGSRINSSLKLMDLYLGEELLDDVNVIKK